MSGTAFDRRRGRFYDLDILIYYGKLERRRKSLAASRCGLGEGTRTEEGLRLDDYLQHIQEKAQAYRDAVLIEPKSFVPALNPDEEHYRSINARLLGKQLDMIPGGLHSRVNFCSPPTLGVSSEQLRKSLAMTSLRAGSCACLRTESTNMWTLRQCMFAPTIMWSPAPKEGTCI